jgi:hypothetical protein
MPREKRSEVREARRFAWILSALLVALSGLWWWRGLAGRAAGLLGAAALVLALALAVRPLWLRLFRGWMRFAEGLAWVSTRVLLALFYFVVLTPVGLVFRLARRDALDLAWKDRRPSYWIDREPVEPSVERYEKQF